MLPKLERQKRMLIGLTTRRAQYVYLGGAIICFICNIYLQGILMMPVQEVGVSSRASMAVKHVQVLGQILGFCLGCLGVYLFFIGRALAAFGLDRPEKYDELRMVAGQGSKERDTPVDLHSDDSSAK